MSDAHYQDFGKAIAKRVNKFRGSYPAWQTELQAIATALDADTITHNMTITDPIPALKVGVDKSKFQNQVLHVVNKGKSGNMAPSMMADAISDVLGVALPPGRIDTPALTGGDGSVGVQITCTMGNWANSPDTYAYQWKKVQGGVTSNLPSAVNTYTPPSNERGHDIWCTVTATNAAGSAASDSNRVTVK
jgi:hypothetical protein